MGARGLVQRQRERVLAGDRRAGRFARSSARTAQYEYVRHNWLPFVAVGLAALAAPFVTLFFLPNGFSRGLMVGVSTTAVVSLLSFWVVQVTGTAPIMMGDQGEQWTAQELRKTRRRGWRLVNDISMKAWNIDHVMVGPGGAFAVETKWSATPWTVNPPDDRVTKACDQVSANAKTLSIWLQNLGLGSVEPVVFLWGANARDLPANQQLSRDKRAVTVVAGPHAKAWISQLPTDRLSHEQMDLAWRELDEHCRRRDAHEDAKGPMPLSLAELVAHGALAALAASASFLTAAWWLARGASPLWWLPLLVALFLPAATMLRFARSGRYLAWGWIGGACASALLVLWALARWMLDRGISG